MRAPALALLATVALAAALPAQVNVDRGEGGLPVISVVVGHPVGRVYRRAIDVMHSAGFRVLAMHVDEMLLTPQAVVAPTAMNRTPTMAQINFEPRGDSTKIQVQVVPVDAERKARCETDPCFADAMAVGVSIVAPLTSGLDSLPPEPRTAADSLREAGAYGYSPTSAIPVGGLMESGRAREQAYLGALRGPGGEAVSFFRIGSCCPFESPRSTRGPARIDVYEVAYPGLAKPVLLYFDVYRDPDGAGPPAGFTRASEGPPST
ncbi:MAG TPA: hypothetical protein VFR81_13345 [Longimicrobium sp.]|nr:hypothetical protein [Longimicrobium sp.]